MDTTARPTPRRAPTTFDEVEARALVDAAITGDDASFTKLCALLWPFWTQVARRSRALTLLGRGEDAVRDVATTLAEKLSRDDRRALRQWTEWVALHPERGLADWMTIVTTNAIRSYVRKSTVADPGSTATESKNRLLRDFFAQIDVDQLGESPGITPKQTARQIIEAARERLPPRQLSVLSMWLEGVDFVAIAAELRLGGGSEEARRHLRAACATLRRAFSGG